MEPWIPIVVVLVLFLLMFCIFTVRQGTVKVLTVFGKFKRVAKPGLQFKLPWEKRYRTISIQNITIEQQFQAITTDQAAVYFESVILYSVKNDHPETVKNACFAFNSQNDFFTALEKMVEGEVRTFVAGKKQEEIIKERQEVVDAVKVAVDDKMEAWGYELHDLQITDIKFGQTITASMEEVVASANLRKAAENKGQALLIEKTKEAEANAAFVTIQAKAEKEAWELRGQGLAKFREEIAKGLAESADLLKKSGVEESLLAFSLYCETLKDVAKENKGATIFMDSGASASEDILSKLIAAQNVKK